MYPQPVIDVANKIYDISEELFVMNFPKKDTVWLKETAIKSLCKSFLEKFIAGKDLKFDDFDEIKDILTTAIFDISVVSLKELKLLDTIEDENGETVIFLTERGKKLAKSYNLET